METRSGNRGRPSSTAGSNAPRTGYLDWDDYFMGIAFLSAQRSKDPITQVGACIINKKKRVVGTGYNGMPNRCNDKDLPWGKGTGFEESKHFYVCHAELNAVLNSNSATLKDCKIYVSLFPCNECAKVIIQSGIKEVIFCSDKHSTKESMKASRKMLDLADVKYSQFVPKDRDVMTYAFSSNDPVQKKYGHLF